METKDFLNLVLPQGDMYYILSGKAKLRSATSKTIDGLSSLIDSANQRRENVYVGLAAYKAGASREGQNVTAKQCLYVDMDCGPSKDYADKSDALSALKAFLSATKFPVPTIIVDSGNGIHAYWVTKEVMIPSEWTSMATGLKQLLASTKTAHDTSVIADITRTLRVPGSFNYKDAVPKACTEIGRAHV